jgi:hypothetical protein
MLTKKENQNKKKENMGVDDESLDMNDFDKLKEGKHHETMSNNDDDSMSSQNTNNLFNFGQNNSTDKSCLDSNYNNCHSVSIKIITIH